MVPPHLAWTEHTCRRFLSEPRRLESPGLSLGKETAVAPARPVAPRSKSTLVSVPSLAPFSSFILVTRQVAPCHPAAAGAFSPNGFCLHGHPSCYSNSNLFIHLASQPGSAGRFGGGSPCWGQVPRVVLSLVLCTLNVLCPGVRVLVKGFSLSQSAHLRAHATGLSPVHLRHLLEPWYVNSSTRLIPTAVLHLCLV